MKMHLLQRVGRIVLGFSGIILLSQIGFSQVVTLNKEGFQLSYDCTNRTAIRYDYSLSNDTGSASRPNSYNLDPDLPEGCEGQFTSASYASVQSGWDRGHLVTSNHMDASSVWMKRANFMSNIVPQASSFNQGIWLQAENIAECYRDLAPLRVVGGLLYNDESNDYFLNSHGIRTADYFWKTIITTDSNTGEVQTISWLIPNNKNLSDLDSYIVSIAELESLLGTEAVDINVPNLVKIMKPSHSWELPEHCDRG